MAQLFHPSTNTLAKASLYAIVLGVCVLGLVAWGFNTSSYYTYQGIPREQPVMFSHQHHVQGLGLDCRYCHTSVTDSGFAGLPPTKTCMTCHSKIWTDAPLLEPVRKSWATGEPIHWTRVHNLPDFVYFQHDIHVNKGIGCVVCHGRVDEMPITWQNANLEMRWCLECHRDPRPNLRPRDQVFNMTWSLDAATAQKYSDAAHKVTDQVSLGQALIDLYHIPTDGRLTNCYTCHR